MAAVNFQRNAVGGLTGVLAVAGMNDNWIKFNGQSDAVSAEVEVDNGTTQKTFVISPDANGEFFFNVKEAVMSFFKDATDDFDYNGEEVDPSDLVQSIDFNITITHTTSPDDSGTVSAKFIKSKKRIPESIFIQAETKLTHKAILFDGFPICISKILSTGEFTRTLLSTWSQIGNTLSISGIGDPRMVALSSNRIAFIDDTNDELTTYDFDGTDWTQVGNALSVSVADHSIAALTSSRIALVDDNTNELRTYDFDGTDWSQTGNSLTIASINDPFIASLTSSRIAFVDDSSNELRTYDFDGTNWSQVGNSLVISGASFVQLVGLTSARIAFTDRGNDELSTYDFDGTDWSLVGNALSIGNIGDQALGKISADKVVYLDDNNDKLTVYEFDGTDWTIDFIKDLSISSSGLALVALSETRIVLISEGPDLLTTYDFGPTSDIDFTVSKDCGTYLKWLNELGGYSYFLFDNVQIDIHQITDVGQAVNPAIDEPNFPFFELDKNETLKRSLEGTATDQYEVNLFKSLIKSNEVYLFTGEKGDNADSSTWMRVKVVPGSYRFSNKRDAVQFGIQIQLP